MNNRRWIVPAVASAAFLVFSVCVMVLEGPFGFLAEHAHGGWGAQVAIDLFTSVTVGLALVWGRAQKVGVRRLPWVLLTVATGSIGLLAFIARVFYVEAGARAASAGEQRSLGVRTQAAAS